LTNIIVGLGNLISNIWLVPIFGKVASAWITLFSFLTLSVVNLILIHHLFGRESFRLRTILGPALLFILSMFIYLSLDLYYGDGFIFLFRIGIVLFIYMLAYRRMRFLF
jgi:O-antigen/teichoic acid export membrane protein